MPYIKPERRPPLDRIVDEVVDVLAGTPSQEWDGQLNYLITRILKRLYEPSYLNYERVMGLLSCIQHEFYRRFIASYEDRKIVEYGDIC
ncbi:hypothetical protein KEJ40_01145 [Candidatus Bathyarchaeota archaeon]|nr:hypothetical protein [Candidatus Bathyarchaeota archaeon]